MKARPFPVSRPACLPAALGQPGNLRAADSDSPRPKLLVLDLDETLVHACETRLAHEPHFGVGPYAVYERPGVRDFIAHVLGRFEVGVWTSSGEQYAAAVVDHLFPPGSLRFVWASSRCTLVRDWQTGGQQWAKKLCKLKARGYRLESIIAVDDTPAKYAANFGNLVAVREFLGDPADTELPLLSRYLDRLALVPNVRVVEKRGWREDIGRQP